MRNAFRLLAVAPVIFAATLVACGGASSSPASAAGANARNVSEIDNRLQGSWRLVDYRPAVAPDPMFQALLTSQVGVMVVRFERGNLYADSPTFHVMRAYRIVEAAGPQFSMESPDVGGAVFTTSATVSDDGQHITFRGDTEPWRGTGSLVRVQ